MKKILKYLLELILVVFLGFVAFSTSGVIFSFKGDQNLLISSLFIILCVVSTLGALGIVYRWIRDWNK